MSEHTLDNLKRQAKRWLKALRENVPEAGARLERAFPEAPAAPTLRDVQHALARELGFIGWTALKTTLDADRPAERSAGALVNRFLDNACPDHHVRGRVDHIRAQATAMRLLEHAPDIAHENFYTDIVCGDLAAVERALAERPELVSQKNAQASQERSDAGGAGDLYEKDLGPKGWEPLLYLCFTRLPAVTENSVAIAKLLLDHGADPNVYFMAGASQYTPLVGAIGEGEEDRPPHQRRNELVKLLLDRGAEPYDGQVVYNIHFRGDLLWFLEMMYERALQLGRKADWDDPEWSMLSQGRYGSGARWHLTAAIINNDVALAEWCLSHGANPNSPAPSDPRFLQFSLYEGAVRNGRLEIAELLVRYGATRTEIVLDDMDAFISACMRLDRDEVRSRLAAHPEFLRRPEPLFAAARADRRDVAELLLDLGTSPNVENEQKERPLHVAGYENALHVAELLIARGAEIDPRESNWMNTPLAAAAHYQHRAMIDLFSRYSRDVWELTYSGKVERLREVLAEDPARGRVSWEGESPLMWLPPHGEDVATEAARLLLASGADPTLRNKHGQTAADRAESMGMFGLAALLSSEASQSE